MLGRHGLQVDEHRGEFSLGQVDDSSIHAVPIHEDKLTRLRMLLKFGKNS